PLRHDGNSNVTIFNSSEPKWKERFKISIRIDGRGLDPGAVLHFQRITFALQAASYRGFHSFYEEIKNTPPPILATTKNLFLALAETIAQTLKVSSCYICGGINTGDHCPWQARELDPLEPHNETAYPQLTDGVWLLRTAIIGRNCLARRGGRFNVSVGSLTCLGLRYYNLTAQKTQWWSSSNRSEPKPNPLSNFSLLRQAWEDISTNIQRRAPKGLYWICEKMAYSILPPNWAGAYVLGTIRPSFFLLPLSLGEKLGVPIYRAQGAQRDRRALQIGDWKDDKMAPRKNNSILWACHLSRGWLLGISHPCLYAEVHYQTTGGFGTYNK
uniref:Uncharacterized protein n=2 Tax=Sus scrofa TaxID=9823 RepID=A0A8D1CNF4_PIG